MPAPPRVAILGVTGFIGNGLPALFTEKDMASTGVSRSGGGSVAGVDLWQKPDALDLSGHHAVINLAGFPVNCRWTDENKRKIRESRIEVTRNLVDAIRRAPPEERPKVLVNGSAVGIYGDRGDEVLVENSHPGEGFLAEICRDWEEVAMEAEPLGLRVVLSRTAVVFGRGGGAFDPLARVFKLGIGGKLGSGRQWMPWIHLDDMRAAIVHAVFSETLAGPMNAAAPHPERNADLTRKFAAALHRPAILPVPGFALKLALGGFGGTPARQPAREARSARSRWF
jgi:uncharacterized protein